MKRYSYILFFFIIYFVPIQSFSENIYNVCSILEEKIIENRLTKELMYPETIGYNHGFVPQETFKSGFKKYKRTHDNFIILGSYVGLFYDNFKLSPKSKILELNHENTSELSDAEIDKIIDIPKPIHAKFQDNKSSEIVEISSLYDFDDTFVHIAIDFEILDITEINSKNSSYNAGYSLDFSWTDYGIDEIINTIKNDAPENFVWENFTCSFGKEDFESLKIYLPIWNIQNLVTIGDQELQTTYLIQHFIEESELYTEITQKNQGISIFKTYFDFSAFPFDRQNLSFKFSPNDDGLCYRTEFDVTDFSKDALLKSFEKIKFIEWNKDSINYHSYFDENISCEYSDSGMQINFFVERNYNYFLTKILIPIFLILIISWSVFWIRPNLIEPRLTVSIVCLLSLIAYNFVVDDDLPKLSYLTVMDLMILFSYFFATLPTLITIFNHAQNSDIIALKIDRLARIFIPLLYILSTLIINVWIISSSSNTISAFNF